MTLSNTHWLVLGAGYTGNRLCRYLLEEGGTVTATRRSADAVAELVRRHGEGLVGKTAILAQKKTIDALPFQDALVVLTAPPDPHGPQVEAAFVRAAGQGGARRLVYLSSTGVYGQGKGEWIDEDTPPGPQTEHGRARFAAEKEVLAVAEGVGLQAVALRAAGIYGPERGIHVRMRTGNYKVIGDGATYVNRIHVDDLCRIIVAAATVPSLRRSVYNVADDQPMTARAVADAIATQLALPEPGSMPEELASQMARDLLLGNRRIQNQRMKDELAVTLEYPTWREGLEQALAEEQAQRL